MINPASPRSVPAVAICCHPQTRFGPRVVREDQLQRLFAERFDVYRWPDVQLPPPPQQPSRFKQRFRPAARYLAEAVFLDRFELTARRESDLLEAADPAAGLLIGAPYSTCAVAAEVLARLDRPYIVDLGDPWVLTGPNSTRRLFGGLRQRRVERRLWEGAAGAVLTTDQQADDLNALFPDLEIMVRPNGYLPVETIQPDVSQRDPDLLRLVHYGTLYGTRVDLEPVLTRLADSGFWKRIELTQYGSDWSGALDGLPPNVSVQSRVPQPWDEIVGTATEFDAALVVGFGEANQWQLPSKAIQYLTLPIPRLAVGSTEESSLCSYTRGKPGYLTVTVGELDLPELLRQHLERDWTSELLAPPPEEAWPQVADDLAGFFFDRTGLA